MKIITHRLMRISLVNWYLFESDDLDINGESIMLTGSNGAGKSTIARNLLENDPGLSLSVSVTTRPRRGSEIEGVHYHFKSRRDFERMRDSEALLEWAEVHGNCYGTPREAAEVAMSEGRDMLFDIDWQGGQQILSLIHI